MCIYSAPIEPQYVVFSAWYSSPKGIVSRPTANDPTLNSRSKSLEDKSWYSSSKSRTRSRCQIPNGSRFAFWCPRKRKALISCRTLTCLRSPPLPSATTTSLCLFFASCANCVRTSECFTSTSTPSTLGNCSNTSRHSSGTEVASSKYAS